MDGCTTIPAKGSIKNKQPISVIIDSGSPITIFTREDMRRLLERDLMFARPLPKNEEYVDYNGRPPNPSEFIDVDVQVGKVTIKKARMIIAREGKRSLVDRDYVTQLNFRIAEAKFESEYEHSVKNIVNKVDCSQN